MTTNKNQLAVLLPEDKTVPYQHLYGAFGEIDALSDDKTCFVHLDADITNASHLFSKERVGKPIQVDASDVAIAQTDNPLIMASLKATLTNILATSLYDSHLIAMKQYLAQVQSEEDIKEVNSFDIRCRASIAAYRELIKPDTPTKYQSINFAARSTEGAGLSQVFYVADSGVSPQFKSAKAVGLYKALSVMFEAAQKHHESNVGDAVLLWNGRFELQVHEELDPNEFIAFLANNGRLMNYIILAANAQFVLDSSTLSIEQAIALIARSPFATNPYFLRTATH